MTNLYVVAPSEAGPCKIGITKNPTSRLGELQVGNPDRLIMWSTWTVKDGESPLAIEKEVHGILAHRRLLGEWFAVTVQEAEQCIVSLDEDCRIVVHPSLGVRYYVYDGGRESTPRKAWSSGPIFVGGQDPALARPHLHYLYPDFEVPEMPTTQPVRKRVAPHADADAELARKRALKAARQARWRAGLKKPKKKRKAKK